MMARSAMTTTTTNNNNNDNNNHIKKTRIHPRRKHQWQLLLCSALASTANAMISNDELLNVFRSDVAERVMNEYVLISQRSGPQDMEQSTEYRWTDMFEAYDLMINSGISGKTFFVGDSVESATVNLALFLAQSMKETIQYNACDENNWSMDMNYPATSACGQAGQDYGQYKCTASESFMECPVDPNMAIQARTHAQWGGAPPPLFCAPKSTTGTAVPRWDFNTECGPAGYQDIPTFPDPYIDDVVLGGLDQHQCNAYEGQFSGFFTFDGCDPSKGCPNANSIDTAGGTIHHDVEGCCWWGRGVIQTTGPCNFGKLNYFLTGTRYDNGVASKDPSIQASHPDLNLCTTPNALCDGPPELKWISGMFYWIFDVQEYESKDGFSFDLEAEVRQSAQAIFDDPAGATAKTLLDKTSGLVNRGCPALTCPDSGNVDGIVDRFNNFKRAMTALKHIVDSSQHSIASLGSPAPVAEGAWYSKETLCEVCANSEGQCGLKYSRNGAAQCIGWANNQQECEGASTVAAAWCGQVANPTDPPTRMPITPPPSPQPTRNPTISPTTPGQTREPTTSSPTKSPSLRPTTQPGGSFAMCTGCFGTTAGPCQQSNGVCWEFWVGAPEPETCPVGTSRCVSSEPQPTEMPANPPVANPPTATTSAPVNPPIQSQTSAPVNPPTQPQTSAPVNPQTTAAPVDPTTAAPVTSPTADVDCCSSGSGRICPAGSIRCESDLELVTTEAPQPAQSPDGSTNAPVASAERGIDSAALTIRANTTLLVMPVLIVLANLFI